MERNGDIEKLKFSEHLLNDLNLIVISTDDNGDINYVSPATEKIIGYKPFNLLGKKWWEKTFFNEEERLSSRKRLKAILAGEIGIELKPYDRKIRCKNGKYKWIEWRDSFSENNSFVSVGVDITEWKKTEEIKIQSDSIINSVNSMILVSDKGGGILFASPSVEKMLGYKFNEIKGDKWWKVTYENQEEAARVKESIHNFVFFQVKNFVEINKRRIKTKDGSYKWIEWQVSKGVNDTYISIGTDITNRILTEIELKKAKEFAEKSLKVKNDFLANMSHEIRTPLNAIIGFTDLLLESELTIEQREHLETMRNSGEILLSLINNVLDLSKLESDKLEVEKIPFNLQKNLYEVVKLMKIKAHEKRISLELKIAPNTPAEVIGDPTRLGQILLNLIGNAVKFTNEGSVEVAVSLKEEKQKKLQVYFEIRDTGIGIVPNKINTVFGVFTQAKSDTSRIYGGTGLGLAIVKKLVKLLNGEITVESKFGKGSIFKMTLPFIRGDVDVKSKLKKISPSVDSSLGLNILVVEDNKTNQLLAKTRLERWGCNVDIANNGIEGVKKAQVKLYDIILMDIQMPIMDGYEATKIIKNDLSEKAAKTPIIAMTAYTSKKDIGRALSIGMSDYIFKPFKVDELFTMLKKYGTKGSDISIVEEEITRNEIKEDVKEIGVKNYLDLTFLKQETLNENSILKLLIEAFINDLNEFLEAINIGFNEKDWQKIYKATHKIKPSISMFGISVLEPKIHSLMINCKEEKRLGTVDELIKYCKEILGNVMDELLVELKKMNK